MDKKHKLLINGQWRETGTGLKVQSPYDKKTVGVTYLAGEAEIQDALSGANSACAILKKLPSYKRAEVIRKVAEGINARADELARTITLESGKPIRDARAEVRRAVATFELAAEESKRLGGEVMPLDIMPGSEGRIGIIRRFPVGVVLGISPFNFPLNLVAHKVAPAMASGNPIILKPAQKTPISALLLGEIVTAAGWPAGGLNVVVTTNEDAEKLFADERVKKLTFTGSAHVGWMLKNRAGAKKITLELGGNAGAVVHEDADIETAAKRCVAGAFAYSGQVCISVQRIYAHRPVFERFKKLFLEHCSRLKSGDPLDETTDMGPMIDEAAAARTDEWVQEAVAGGARVLTGGDRKGGYYPPTVLTGTIHSMKVCCEELFAPVAVLESYDTFEEAIDSVNAGPYGLQAGVFTKDMSRIFYAYEALEVGGVVVNDIPTFRVDNMPYGGVKMSGFGREGVRYAIEEMTELKLMALKL